MDDSIKKFLEESRRLQKLTEEADLGKKLGLSSLAYEKFLEESQLQKLVDDADLGKKLGLSSSAYEKFLEERRLQKLVDDADLGKKLGSSSLAFDQIHEYLSASESLKGINFPAMPIPEPIRMPRVPTFEENNDFQSASVLLRRLADSIIQWRTALPDDVQPAIIAILQGGIQIEVERLAQESFHGIRIEGQLKGSPCVVLAHQATVQLLCFVQTVNPPDTPRRSIGFIINGEESKA